jgi:hypothetical protein
VLLRGKSALIFSKAAGLFGYQVEGRTIESQSVATNALILVFDLDFDIQSFWFD